MIINANPNPAEMGYSELVELYGEELGFSIGKTLRKTKNAVKTAGRVTVKAAKVVARNPAAFATGGVSLLAPKSIQKKLNSAVRITSTGGASLLVSKQDRNAVGKVARVTQSAVLRPTAGVLATAGRTAARSPIVQKAAGTAFRSFVPGGSALLDTASTFQKLTAKKKNIPMPAALRPRSASGSVGQARPYRGPSSSPSAPAAAQEAAPASSFPIIPVAIGGAGLLLVLALTMGKKK